MKFRNNSLITFALFALFLLGGCQAQDNGAGFPEGCNAEGYKISGKALFLNNETRGVLNLFLFHNISEDTIYINHEPKDDPGASAGWSTELAAGNWTAITMSQGNFAFTCGKMVPDKFDEVPCGGDLDVCKFQNPVFSKESKGNYWVSENKPLDATLEAIQSRGIEVNK